MVTINDKRELSIRSFQTYNMSNWQITDTVYSLTSVNNKFDVLNKINELINEGCDKKNIFVTDKSFLISTNYKTYFEKGNILDTSPNSILKVASIGRIITMQYNERIIYINSLFEYYKNLNSILNKNLRCRLKGNYLADSYNELCKTGIESGYDVLKNGALQQIRDIFGKFTSPDIDKMNMIIKKINHEKDNQLMKNRSKFERLALESKKKFAYTFNRFDRPVIGVYNELENSFQIINADQMFKNGEDDKNQIRLKNISKNSPVIITFIVTGTMLCFLSYLVYRNHKVNKILIKNDIVDVPKDKHKVINNVFSNVDGQIIEVNADNKKVLDQQLKELAESSLTKLEIVTNNKKVHLEMNCDYENRE